jgi:TetR/AcrR family transcriptional repressor of nem operon
MPIAKNARARLLSAGRQLMLTRGFTATSVDEICAEAGLTKGSFFHHFGTKDEFGEALLNDYWASTQEMLQAAPFVELADPLERVHGYLDLFVALAGDDRVAKSCLFGNVSQELAPTHPALRAACSAGFSRWADQIASDLEQAKRLHPPRDEFDSVGLAEHFIAIYEGSLVLAKAKGDARVLADNVEHFRAYLDALFGRRS